MSSSTCPRCETPKPSHMFACRECWYALSRDTRRAIGRAYRDHGAYSAEWVAAAKAAIDDWGIPCPDWLLAMEEAFA